MGYGIKIFVPRPLYYVTRSPGRQERLVFRSTDVASTLSDVLLKSVGLVIHFFNYLTGGYHVAVLLLLCSTFCFSFCQMKVMVQWQK